MRTVYVLLTMDCETAKSDVTPYATQMSGSGPQDYEESERSIRGFVETATSSGYPTTLFAHPEVAVRNKELLLALEEKGACLGLHLHPYKLKGQNYKYDLGAYSPLEQREILCYAIEGWESALGKKPLYFRAGYFSANDSTCRVLHELGFLGGGLSNPGRILPSHCSVWAGAKVYPHRAHLDFRLVKGNSDFINVPVSGALGRPVAQGHAGEQGFEWLYIPHTYDHEKIVQNVLERFAEDKPKFGTIVTDTHNDQDYSDPDHPASRNFELILRSIEKFCKEMDLEPVGITLDKLCNLVRKDEE